MRPGEVRAAGHILGSVLAGAVGMVRDVHLSIADRAFRAVGPPGHAVHVAHDGISRAVYCTVGEVQRWVPRVAATAGSLAVPPDAAPLHATHPGNTVLGAVNGLWGDGLAAAGSELAMAMTVRHGRADVAIDRAGVHRAFPDATGRLAVFVHGLCETEDAWWPSARRQRKRGAGNFGERLEADGFTPVYVRYNSGLHIDDNGIALSDVLEDLTAVWPVDVDEIVLIGHSMGGLVARSACQEATSSGARWVDHTGKVFGLGTPHLGAPLERGVNAVARSLRAVPETRGIARLLNNRSAGVKDLRFGSDAPFPAHISYFFVGATITRDRDHPLGVAVGDLLVQYTSATGANRRRPCSSRSPATQAVAGRSSANSVRHAGGAGASSLAPAHEFELNFEIENGHHVGGLTHFDLLSHPDVYEQLERWITTPAGVPPAPPARCVPA